MKLRLEISTHKKDLKRQLSWAYIDSYFTTLRRCSISGTDIQEPDFIAGLVIDFAPNLYHILEVLFPDFKFSVASVYCHQKPIVDFNEVPRPELGDILFVFSYEEKSGEKHFNSLLLQAKINKNEKFEIATSEAHQLKLYTQWPKFKYARATANHGINRNGKEIDIQPKTVNTGAQYLIIKSIPFDFPHSYLFGCAVANKKISVDNSLAKELLNFFRFKTGRPFENNTTSTKDDWTKMIWDLLEIANNSASRRVNSVLNVPFGRLSQYPGLSFISPKSFTNILDNIDRLRVFDGPSNDSVSDDYGGVSVILIECMEIAK